MKKTRNTLLDEEKQWLDNILEEVSNEHLILSKDHTESNAIGCELAYYFGVGGLDYYLAIRKQRKENYDEKNSIDKYYNICKWVESADYVRKGHLQTLRHYYNRAISEKENKEYKQITCGVFHRK